MNTLYFVTTKGNLKFARKIKEFYALAHGDNIESVCIVEDCNHAPWAARVTVFDPKTIDFKRYDLDVRDGDVTEQTSRQFYKQLAKYDRHCEKHGEPKMHIFTHDLTPIEDYRLKDLELIGVGFRCEA